MNTLPAEIIILVNDYLSTKDFVAFSSTCKTLKNCSEIDSSVWKRRTFQDYKVSVLDTFKFKNRYVWCFKNLCICCSKKTTVYHPLKKVKICNSCQETHPEYTLITTSVAKKELFLTPKDFIGVPYCEKTNPWNKERPIKFFLKEDLIVKFRSRFNDRVEEFEYRKKKMNQRFTRQLLYYARLYILKSTLLVKFDIHLEDFIKYVNAYTKGMFRKYILNISKVQNFELTENLILKIRELDFLYNADYPVKDIDYDDFEFLVKNILIHSRSPNNLTRDPYIIERLKDVKKKYKAVFSRKQKLMKALKGLTYSLYDFDIVVYILKGHTDLEQLRLDYVEQEFVVNNLDFLSLNHDTIVSRKSKREIYAEYISRWVAEGNEVPEELRGRYAQIRLNE